MEEEGFQEELWKPHLRREQRLERNMKTYTRYFPR
jgi:hypothetical protein